MTAEIRVNSQGLADDWGVFADLPDPWEGIEMKCPTCASNTPDAWKSWWPDSALAHDVQSPRVRTSGPDMGPSLNLNPQDKAHSLRIRYMRCAADGCGQIVVELHEVVGPTREFLGGVPFETRKAEITSWLIWPRNATRPIDPLVGEPFRRDYLEASAILDLSPRSSGFLARRIVEYLLEKYDSANPKWALSKKIDEFREKSHHPSPLKKNLHDLREMVDTVAHVKTDQVTGEFIDMTRDDADWTLDLVDRLFDYFIIQPERTRQIEAAMDEKMKRTDRPAIRREGDTQ